MTFEELADGIEGKSDADGAQARKNGDAGCAPSSSSSSSKLLYLYDCSLPLKVPTLCERVGVPIYFAHDWLQRTRHLHAFSRSWPSLFVGATGTRSSLHIDQWKGHFWMAQVRKSPSLTQPSRVSDPANPPGL